MKDSDSAGIWRGVLIEEGLKDKSVLDHVRIVRTLSERLESEEGLGEYHFHKVEVDESELDTVLELAMNGLEEAWYFHIVKGSTMKVVFPGRVFEASKGDDKQIETIRAYGMSLGIPREQMVFERLMDNPYDE